MRTPLCDLLGIKVPIVLAPIIAPVGGPAGPRLAAAVSEAGGLGIIALWLAEIEVIQTRIRDIRSLTAKPFAINLRLDLGVVARLEACLEEGARIISLFWGDPSDVAPRAKAAGAIVMQTVRSSREARVAVDCGVDVVVAQGWEAGGHVWGNVATMALVPAVVDAVAPVPVIAAGGIADGRGMAAALALGAEGVWIGTRFLASAEANFHARYRERLLAASETDTIYLENLFDGGPWTDAPARVLRNKTVAEWEAAGRPRPGQRPGENDIVAVSASRGDIKRYTPVAPVTDIEGDIDALPMWAGQGVGLVRKIQPATDIVREIDAEAQTVLTRLGSLMRA
ncbi:putative 2-nitropropane dioxygenase [Mesorhizobium plurifarium]|uniref:Putative 2-nitropropane dioxygenase n=1 Tax=Mesorhizobium plurifarium TaxID=69974 RepID=A0A090ESW5_MESPL|nr:putative 2-nitropropane dioxygenase [Mesorhizobium plurifarium]